MLAYGRVALYGCGRVALYDYGRVALYELIFYIKVLLFQSIYGLMAGWH